VRVGRERHREVPSLGLGSHRPEVERSVHGERTPVAEVDQVRRVAEPVVDHRDDLLVVTSNHFYTIP
jgi:hypothetical protein